MNSQKRRLTPEKWTLWLLSKVRAAQSSQVPGIAARLCRKAGQYKMTVLSGEVLKNHEGGNTTMQFPQARVKMNADVKFLESFGSNHIHMVTGNYVEELRYFCTLTGINYEIY